MTDTTITVRPRAQIPVEHTWNSNALFDSAASWDSEYKKVAELIPTIEQYKGKLSQSAKNVTDALDAIEQIMLRVGKIFIYSQMTYSCDTTNQEAASMDGRSMALYGRTIAATSFVDPELLEIGEAKLRQWLKEEPRLANYAHYIDNLFRLQQHVRSAEVEEVLGLAIEPLSSLENNWTMLTNADLKFRPAVSSKGEQTDVFQGNIGKLLTSPDRELRRTAWESFADGHLSFKNTLANNLGGQVKTDVFNMRVRRYSSALEAALFANNIPVEVFHNLIGVFKKNFPLWHRYWRARRKVLKVDKLHPYDIWAPLSSNDPVVSYDQAVQWISEGLAPLGSEYVNVARAGMTSDRWVDIYPNVGKRAGAFSTGFKGTPPYIMMSFNGDLGGMSTLAHELGHSMHSYLTWKTQPFVYSNYSIFVAEVASNFNQAMVRAHLFEKNPDRDFQLALIDEAMDNFHRYLFIMPTLARFELEFHQRVEKGDSLSSDDLNVLMADLYSEAYGGEMEVDRDRVGITWAQFPHLYANFYVFQYATGISAANALASSILSGESGAAERYLNFLRSGASVYPLDALKIAGVDLASPEPVERGFKVLESIVARLEKLVE